MWERLLRYAQACPHLLGRHASMSTSAVACRTFQVGDAACAAAHDVLEAAHLALIAALGCFCSSADLSSCSTGHCLSMVCQHLLCKQYLAAAVGYSINHIFLLTLVQGATGYLSMCVFRQVGLCMPTFASMVISCAYKLNALQVSAHCKLNSVISDIHIRFYL